MRVSDRGDPRQIGNSALVTITITRNNNNPGFALPSYEKNLFENQTVNEVVQTIVATDNDGTVRD